MHLNDLAGAVTRIRSVGRWRDPPSLRNLLPHPTPPQNRAGGKNFVIYKIDPHRLPRTNFQCNRDRNGVHELRCNRWAQRPDRGVWIRRAFRSCFAACHHQRRAMLPASPGNYIGSIYLLAVERAPYYWPKVGLCRAGHSPILNDGFVWRCPTGCLQSPSATSRLVLVRYRPLDCTVFPRPSHAGFIRWCRLCLAVLGHLLLFEALSPANSQPNIN